MDNKLDIFGGTDWVDGDILYAEDLVLAFENTVDRIPFLSGAQNYFELLKHAGDVDNEDYLIADIFTDADGVKNTIITGDSSATYSADNDCYFITETATYEASGTIVTDTTFNASYPSSNAFDLNPGTDCKLAANTKTFYLGKTFTERFISKVSVNFNISRYSSSGTITGRLSTYDGSTWTTVLEFTSGANIIYNSTIDVYKHCQGVRLEFENVPSSYLISESNSHIYDFKWIGTVNSSSDVETGTLIALDGTEKGIVVYDKSNKPTGTSIDVDVSDGSTTLSNQNVREYIDISSLSSGNLSLDFNLSTTDTSVTPSLYGYGVEIIK